MTKVFETMTEEEADTWAEAALMPYFKAERIADVIRRPAPIWDGKRAIDLIMAGSGIYVLGMYENTLGGPGYQPR
jgi:hypothetical protein